MAAESQQCQKLPPPPVEWAQRKNVILLTIQLEDCKSPVINIESDKLYFRGIGGTEQKEHEVSMPLFGRVVPEESKWNPRGRNIELVLKKSEGDAKFWPHLLKEKKKCGWLKTDFDKWREEEDSEDDELQKLMSRMGGFGDMGAMGGLGGMGGMGGFGGPGDDDFMNFEDREEDEEDEDLPDLE